MSVWTECTQSDLGFNVRATGEQEKKQFIELDHQATLYPSLCPAGSEGTVQGQGSQCLDLTCMHVKHGVRAFFAHVCDCIERVLSKTCDGYERVSGDPL